MSSKHSSQRTTPFDNLPFGLVVGAATVLAVLALLVFVAVISG